MVLSMITPLHIYTAPGYISVFMSKALMALSLPSNECNDRVLSNKISRSGSDPLATSLAVGETTLAFYGSATFHKCHHDF